MPDIATEHDIKTLIDSFYAKLLKSDIAYIFTDVANIDLDHHLPILYSFWNALLFGSGDYRGNPMEVHLQLHQKTPLDPQAFDTWLQLFEATVDEHFKGSKADEAKQKARNIGGLMQFKIQQMGG